MGSESPAEYIHEVEVKVRRTGWVTHLTFVPGSRPPKVATIEPTSYFIGSLFAGDEILQINDQPINSAEDFDRICTVQSKEPKRLRIRVRRDEFYSLTDTEVASPQPQILEVHDVAIRWRSGGMPLGVAAEQDKHGRIVITDVEQDTIAAGPFQFGDVITHVNSKQITAVEQLKTEILTSINTTSKVTLRIERGKRVIGTSVPVPEDVGRALAQCRGYYKRQHKHRPAIATKQSERQPTSTFESTTAETTQTTSLRASASDNRVGIITPTASSVQQIPVDRATGTPKPTPARTGSIKG